MRLKAAIVTAIIVLLTAMLGLITEGLKLYREFAVTTPVAATVTPIALQTKIPLTATPPIPPTPTSDETIRTCAFAGLNTQTLLRVNVDAALYIAGQANNLGFAQSDEIQFPYFTDVYVVQDFNTGIVFAKKDDWSNVKVLKKPITASQLSDGAAREAARIADQFGIRINMGSSLVKVAQAQNLGYPRTGEFKFSCHNETYVGQLFTIAIVYIREKDNEMGIVQYP